MPPKRRKITDRLRLEKFLITGIVEPLTARTTTKTLAPYQQKVVNYMNNHTRLMVVHGTGSGKSFTSANIVNNYLNANASRIALVLAPGSVLPQLKDDILEVTGGNKRVFFMSYELMGMILNPTTHPDYVRLLSRYLNRTLVVCDEIHTVNDNDKKTMFKPLFDTLSQAHKMVIMSATPIKNKKKDLVPYMKLLRIAIPSNEDDYPQAFRGKVSVYTPPQRNVPYAAGQRHFPNLNVSNRNVVVKMTNANKNKILSKPINTYAKLRAVERNVFGNRNPKFETFLQIYTSRPGRTIVYFEEKKSVEEFVDYVKQVLPTAKVQKLIGGMSEGKKKSAVKNESVDIYAITSAGKVGLDFKGIRSIIFMEYPWTASDYWQIVGRGVRTASHNDPKYTNKSVKVYNLMYRSNPGNRRKFKNEIQLNKIQKKENLGKNVKAIFESVNINRNVRPSSVSPRRTRNTNTVARKINNNSYNIGGGHVYSTKNGKTTIVRGGVPYTPQNWSRRMNTPRVPRPPIPPRVPVTRSAVRVPANSLSRINVVTRRLGVS